MSLKLNERYPGRFTNPSADYPLGSFKNRTTPTAKDGSYLEKDWANDKEGFFQSLLSAVGAVANGNVDKVGASQFFDALIQTNQQQTGVAFTTSGTAAAQTLTPTPAITAYVAPLRFRVKFSQASNGSGTLNVSGLGAKNLKQYDSAGAKVPAVYAAGQLGDIEYDGTDFVLLNQLPSSSNLVDTVRINVASASTVNLTTAAPNTRHINITGTATISAFTVAAGQCYFVRFAAALSLVNSASLVTQAAQNITTSAGDTCIIRATAANVVEVLCYAKGGAWGSVLTTNGWKRYEDGLILQWGRSAAVIDANGGVLNVAFPVAYPTDVFFSGVQIVSCSPSNGALAVEAVATSTTNLQITNRDTDSAITQLRWFSLGF